MPDAIAFVISQIGEEESATRTRANEVFNFVVKPLCEEFSLVPKRSDLDPTPGQITVQIIEALTTATVVIADLTGRNPNVYYELGVAHSFGIPVVSLISAASDLPFDMSSERVIELGTGDRLGVAEAEAAKTKLRESLRLVLADDYQARSLVTQAAQARSLDALAPDNPLARELADMRERVDLVVTHTEGLATYRLTANYLYDMIFKLGQKGLINTRSLKSAGVSLEEAPVEGRLDLPQVLRTMIPPPPPPPSPPPPPPSSAPADDDIPF